MVANAGTVSVGKLMSFPAFAASISPDNERFIKMVFLLVF
jgi:hypothetical protein